MARRSRRRAPRRKYRRRRNPSILKGRYGNFGKLAALGIGFGLSQIHMLDQRPVDAIPISYAGVLGAVLFLGPVKGDLAKWSGAGMLIGGGLGEVAQQITTPVSGVLGGIAK